jgi:hypothetical protein
VTEVGSRIRKGTRIGKSIWTSICTRNLYQKFKAVISMFLSLSLGRNFVNFAMIFTKKVHGGLTSYVTPEINLTLT